MWITGYVCAHVYSQFITVLYSIKAIQYKKWHYSFHLVDQSYISTPSHVPGIVPSIAAVLPLLTLLVAALSCRDN